MIKSLIRWESLFIFHVSFIYYHTSLKKLSRRKKSEIIKINLVKIKGFFKFLNVLNNPLNITILLRDNITAFV